MQEEISALEKKNSLEIVDLLTWNKQVRCKWVFIVIFKLINGSFSFILSFIHVQSIYMITTQKVLFHSL